MYRPVTAACLAVAIATTCTTLRAAELVTVWLADGRSLTAEIDPLSDSGKLWLRTADADLTLRRGIAWEQVTKAQRAGEPLPLDELRKLAKGSSTAIPATVLIARPAIGLKGVVVHAPPASSAAEVPRLAVRAIRADAYITNWNADILQDGLAVEVQPLDRTGSLVEVSGTLEVELYAPQIRRFQDAPRNRGVTLELLGRWSTAINPQDLTARGYSVELPFQAIQPETDYNILPWGMVHIKLIVPGDGVFETTLDYVRVRPWSPIRDLYGRHQNRRFLPTERLNRW